MRPEGGIDAALYTALHTTMSLDAAYDLIEIDDVGRSWLAAAHRNNDAISAKLAEADNVGH